MQPSAQTFSVMSFLGVVAQIAGALLLIGFFLMMRRLVVRRAYFSAWTMAWAALAVAIGALVLRYVLVPGVLGTSLPEAHPAVRGLYLVYQTSKGLGFIFFLRGTLMYVAGPTTGVLATRRLWVAAVVFAIVSTLASRHGLNEMVVWQSLIAVPSLGYCASALLWLPRPRRTTGSMATGACFALLATLWLAYAGAFAVAVHVGGVAMPPVVNALVGFNSYFDLGGNLLLGYSMIFVLMEDNKREIDDAQAELRLTHDQLRRAALYDSLTDTLNRHAFAERVGLEMVRATFGTVVLADLDNLKDVNDRYGHAAGDQLLRRCADVLRAGLRSYDKLYRWGGDEFLIILPSARGADVLRRFQQALDDAVFVPVGGEESAHLQVSLGAADYVSSEELPLAIERADRAMYQEKNRRKSDARTPAPGSIPSVASPSAVR